jgi:hypothetical protein
MCQCMVRCKYDSMDIDSSWMLTSHKLRNRKKSWHALVYTMYQNSNLFSFIFLVGPKYVVNCYDLRDIKRQLN